MNARYRQIDIEQVGPVCCARLRNPRLPAFVDDVLLRNLQLGEARADLRIRRVRDEVALDIARTHGKMQVSVVLSA